MAYPESNEQFNRQQGEELIAALTGEEAPDLGYPATNEQFNREQGNRLIEAVKNFGPEIPEAEASDIGKILGVVSDGEEGAKYELVEDGGLPDPSELPDGTAMVAVNGEWKMQEGYGYYKHPNSVTLVCDEMRVGEQSFSKTMNFTKLDFAPNTHFSLTVETPSETEVIEFDVPLGFSFTKTFTVGIYTIIMNAHVKHVETSDIPSIIVTGAMSGDQIKISGFVDANVDISYVVPFSSDFVTSMPKTLYANSLVYVSNTGYRIIDPPTTAGNYLLRCEAVQSGFAMNIQYSWIPDPNTTVTV